MVVVSLMLQSTALVWNEALEDLPFVSHTLALAIIATIRLSLKLIIPVASMTGVLTKTLAYLLRVLMM